MEGVGMGRVEGEGGIRGKGFQEGISKQAYCYVTRELICNN